MLVYLGLPLYLSIYILEGNHSYSTGLIQEALQTIIVKQMFTNILSI